MHRCIQTMEFSVSFFFLVFPAFGRGFRLDIFVSPLYTTGTGTALDGLFWTGELISWTEGSQVGMQAFCMGLTYEQLEWAMDAWPMSLLPGWR